MLAASTATITNYSLTFLPGVTTISTHAMRQISLQEQGRFVELHPSEFPWRTLGTLQVVSYRALALEE